MAEQREHPHRHRLYRGRNTHATRAITTDGRHATACGHLIMGNDTRLPDNAPVTCPDCERKAK